jgi:repressor LexA
MPKPLNELERKVLEYIVDYLRRNTYQPSIREIGREFSIKSTKTVSELLQALANKGWIERDPSRSRGVRVIGLEGHPGTVSVPIVQADMVPGADYFQIDRRFAGTPGSCLMRMPGDHLTEHGIRAGDLLLVEPVTLDQLDAGDVVVARLGETVAVRRVSSAGDAASLEPAVAGEVAVALAGDQAAAALQGRVTGVMRRLRPPAANAVAATVGIAH